MWTETENGADALLLLVLVILLHGALIVPWIVRGVRAKGFDNGD